MKNFEEMNVTEMMETNGGFIWLLPIVPVVAYEVYKALKK